MGLFDRNPKKSDADDSSVSADRASQQADRQDDDLFDAIDELDVPDAPGRPSVSEDETRPLTVGGDTDGGKNDEAAAPESAPEATAPADLDESDSDDASDVPADTSDSSDNADEAVESETTVIPESRPKRDIYEMTGRARPQRIEPRAPEPEPAPEPAPAPAASSDVPADDSRTTVFGGPAPAADPEYAAVPGGNADSAGGTDSTDNGDNQNETLVFAAGAGAAGAVGAAGAAGATATRGPVPDSTEAPETTTFAAGAPTAQDGDQWDNGSDADAFTPVSPDAPEDQPEDTAAVAAVDADPKRGTLDFGLLILRVVVGALLIVRGLQTLFAFGGDPGISAFEQTLAAFDFADILAVAIPVAQIVGGGLLVFGLLTPVGGAVAVVVAGFLTLQNVAMWDSGYWPYSLSPQAQLWGMVGVAALVLTFTGPGRYSADISRGWATRPLASAWVFAVVGVAGAVALWFAVGGGTPF